ncbi:hypothetical protein H0H93_011811, partial [Arthromyces matolae]
MKAEFEAMVAAMKVEADHEAQCLFASDRKRKVFEDLNEGKQQSNEPAGRDAEDQAPKSNNRAHMDPTTQREGRAVAVWYRRLAEHVQRDTNAGNCLPDGKTSDLEYAQPYNEPVGHDPRMGTPAFMAAEYLSGSYYLTPRALDGAAPAASQVVAQFKAKEEKINKASDDPHRTRFNFYHDLESIFWIYIWYLHYRFPKKLMQSNPNLTPLNNSAQKLFLNVIADNRQRTNLIFEEVAAFKLLETLRPIYTPEFRVSLECVAARSLLVHAYKLLEETIPVGGLWDLAKFDDVYYTLMKAEFEAMISAMKVEAEHEAQCLFTSDTKGKVSEDLNEGKQQADKPAGHDAEEYVPFLLSAEIQHQSQRNRTHVDPTTPRDRKAVAAWYIRLAGYLYHDISAENGLWNGKMVKLSELEYTRPYRKLVGHGHGPRTGTPAFMAAEYLHGKYEFTSRVSASGDLSRSQAAAQ